MVSTSVGKPVVRKAVVMAVQREAISVVVTVAMMDVEMVEQMATW